MFIIVFLSERLFYRVRSQCFIFLSNKRFRELIGCNTLEIQVRDFFQTMTFRINFLFTRRSFSIDNWDFTANTARNGGELLVPKIALCRQAQREMFVKRSLREPMFVLVDFVLMTRHPLSFLNVFFTNTFYMIVVFH